MRITKTLTAATLASLLATSVFAGGLAAPVVEAPIVVAEPPMAETSSWGIVLPLVALGLLVALAVSSDSSDES